MNETMSTKEIWEFAKNEAGNRLLAVFVFIPFLSVITVGKMQLMEMERRKQRIKLEERWRMEVREGDSE